MQESHGAVLPAAVSSGFVPLSPQDAKAALKENTVGAASRKGRVAVLWHVIT